MSNVTVKLPGSVWYDYLDPRASDMQADIGLPEPQLVKHGKGERAIYEGVSWNQADDLAEYLTDRAYTLLGQDPDPAENRVHRAAIKAADRITAHVRASKVSHGITPS